jgi:hypothetical protein
LAGIVPNFFFGSQSAKLFFWQPKPLLAVGTRELVAFILNSIFLAVKSVFGRILQKIKVGTISAKNKSWQTQSSFLLFARTHCHSLCKDAHTTHTTEKRTSTTHPSSHHIQTSVTLRTPHLVVPEALGLSVNVNMLPSPSPDRWRRTEK